MRILIVTEMFLFGGMETQIIGQIKKLVKNGNEIFLATGTIDKNQLPNLNVKGLLTDLPLGPKATANELIFCIERLATYIRENYISVVHAHPFTSIVPSVFAANKAGIPVVLTLHGPASLKSAYGPLYDRIIRDIILPEVSHIFCVSEETQTLATTYSRKEKTSIMPNSIDIDQYSALNYEPDKPWAVISRLDRYKTVGIKDFISKADSAGVKEIHIYGDGEEKEHIIAFIKENNITPIVVFKGITYNLNDELVSGYSGIGGMGRVVLEGVASNLPVALIGYDGVKGLVDENLINDSRWWNYSGRGIKNIDAADFERQVGESLRNDQERFRLREWVIEHANDNLVWKDYEIKLSQLGQTHSQMLADVLVFLKTHIEYDIPYLDDSDLLNDLNDFIGKFYTDKCRVISTERFTGNKYKAERDSALLSVEQYKQSLLEQRVALEEQINRLNNSEYVLTNEKIALIASEAMLKQSLLEQRVGFEERVRYLSDLVNALSGQKDSLLVSEAMHKQALFEQRLNFEQIINEKMQIIESLKEKLNKFIK